MFKAKLEATCEKIGLRNQVYHGGESMVGNTVVKMFNDINSDCTLLECFDGYDYEKQKFLSLWKILTNCFNLLTTKNISDEKNEELANELEKFTFFFPLYFPIQNLTRKMHVFSLVLSKFIRKYKMGYKMLQLEQKTESLHHTLNDLEKGLVSIQNRGERILAAIRLFNNQKQVDMSVFKK